MFLRTTIRADAYYSRSEILYKAFYPEKTINVKVTLRFTVFTVKTAHVE